LALPLVLKIAVEFFNFIFHLSIARVHISCLVACVNF